MAITVEFSGLFQNGRAAFSAGRQKAELTKYLEGLLMAKSGDLLEANHRFKAAMETGIVEAKYNFAVSALVLRKRAEGKKRNELYLGIPTPAEAHRLLKEAADEGLLIAQRDYGHALFRGYLGMQADREEGKRYLKLAAEKNDPPASKEYAFILFEEKVNVQEIIPFLEPLIHEGDNEALYMKGYYLMETEGKDRDEALALKCLEQAALSGVVKAKTLLGALLLRAETIPQDHKRAFQLFQDAAKEDPDALFQIARCYKVGQGVPRNPRQSAHYFKLAADKGMLVAKLEWAKCLYEGFGVKRNEALALSLFQTLHALPGAAEEEWFAEAHLYLGTIAIAGKLAGRPSLEEGLAHFKKGAELGDPTCFFQVGFCYQNGIAAAKNPEEALVWFKQGAEKGCEHSHFMLGLEASSKNNSETAETCFKLAYQGGLVAACALLGTLLQKRGCAKEAEAWIKKILERIEEDPFSHAPIAYYALAEYYSLRQEYKTSVRWVLKANALGLPAAKTLLGCAYLEGKGIRKDLAQAFRLFKENERCDPVARVQLGYMYEKGWGTAKDCARALELYKSALDAGIAFAREHYERLHGSLCRN